MKRLLTLRLLFVALFVVAVSALYITVPAFAQDNAPAPAPATEISPWAPLIGAGITMAVALFKNFPWVKEHPKVIALGISLLVTAAQAFAGARPSTGVLAFGLNVLTQLAAAVGTHEMVVKPLKTDAPTT